MSESDIKDEVRELLLEHRGSDNPITSREINEIVGLDDIGSFPSTRAVIREIVMEDRIPIAGSSQGYYVIETEDELEDYIENLENRITNIAERRYGVLRAVRDWDEEIVDEDSDIL